MNHPHVKLPWSTHPVDCALYGAVREIAALANIPENRRQEFYGSFSHTLYFYLQLEHDELRHESPELKDAAFMEAEEAARAALKALSRLTEEQEKLLFRATYKKWKSWWIDCLWDEDYDEEPDPDNSVLCSGYLEKIVRAFSRLTGNPVPDSYRPLGPSGPHQKNWLITQLVGALFIEPWRHGGSLSLHDKDESKGQIPPAIDLLDQIFHFPSRLSLGTIALIRKQCVQQWTEEKEEPPPEFEIVDSSDPSKIGKRFGIGRPLI